MRYVVIDSQGNVRADCDSLSQAVDVQVELATDEYRDLADYRITYTD
jgi:hypothetical protein